MAGTGEWFSSGLWGCRAAFSCLSFVFGGWVCLPLLGAFCVTSWGHQPQISISPAKVFHDPVQLALAVRDLPCKWDWDVPRCVGSNGNPSASSASPRDLLGEHLLASCLQFLLSKGWWKGKIQQMDPRARPNTLAVLPRGPRSPSRGSPLSSASARAGWGGPVGWDGGDKTNYLLFAATQPTKTTTQSNIPGPQGCSGQGQCWIKKVNAFFLAWYLFQPCFRTTDLLINGLNIAGAF